MTSHYSPYLPPLDERLKLRNQNFHSTNKLWNELKLNQTWNIGTLSKLFERSGAKTPEVWERYYIRLGIQRRRKMRELEDYKRKILQDCSVRHKNKQYDMEKLTKQEMMLNYNYGRTERDLNRIANYFKRYLPAHLKKYAYPYVYIRVIDETFLGFRREFLAGKTLQRKLPHLSFVPPSSHHDRKYAIDLEVYFIDTLLCALQIKSPTYQFSNAIHIVETRKMNEKKNSVYTSTYGVPVLYVYSTLDGTAVNQEVFEQVDELIFETVP